MFHEGELSTGIALALQQSKSVACFVRDDGEDSTTWENEWLQDSEVCVPAYTGFAYDVIDKADIHMQKISQLLRDKSVVLRIQAGSQDAGFLSAFCPINEAPALVLIHNGQLLEMITTGASKEEFGQRIRKAFGGGETATETKTTLASSTTTTVADASIPTPAPTTQSEVPSAADPIASANVLREEREARTKASKGKQKQTDPPPDPAPSSNTNTTPSTTRNAYLEQQRQRNSEARKERERVMAQIEADKAERRAKREQERKAREQQATSSPLEATSTPLTSRTRQASSKATSSNLQVRLLDGATIRKQFSADATLESNVRPWIDSHLETKAPYTFKQILAPQPARAISIGEEHGTLRDLELLPSATLVLQPIQAYSDAYESNAGGLLSLPYNAVTGAYGLVSGTLSGAANWLRGGFFRPEEDEGGRTLAQAAQQEARPEEERGPANAPRAPTTRGNMRVRTLADQRDGSVDQQFYNGNSLDFEPNADETKKR